MKSEVIIGILLWLKIALGQYVPEPFGWACYRMALKRDWPTCKGSSGAKMRSCLCGVPEFVDLTEVCLQTAVANASDPLEASSLAKKLSLCKLRDDDYHTNGSVIGVDNDSFKYKSNLSLGNPISNEEIDIAIKTADWRMESDRRAETAGAVLVGFWGLVIFTSYLAFLLGGIIPPQVLLPLLLWGPMRKLRSRLLNPAFGRWHHRQPIFGRNGFRLPTRSMTIIITLFACLNYALMFTHYPVGSQNFIYTTKSQQWCKGLAIRSAFMIMWKLPLVFAFAARNNIFILLHHPWPLDTFNTLHRWIARIVVTDIIIHGSAMTAVKIEQGLYGYVWSVGYWRWGVTGILVASAIAVQSMYWISKANYEVFKALHAALAVGFVIAAWFHVKVLPYGMKHVYAIVAIWGFDQAARITRLIIAGRVRAHLEHLDSSLSTLTISSPPRIYYTTRWSFAFLYIPTLDSFWQSHPFTVLQTTEPARSNGIKNQEAPKYASMSGSSRKSLELFSHSKDLEDGAPFESLDSGSVMEKTRTLTIAIKHNKGLTRKIGKLKAGPLTICLEGPYGAPLPLHRFDEVIFVAGGIGITAHLSYMQRLMEKPPSGGTTMKLYWAVKNIDSMEWALDLITTIVPGVQVEVFTSADRPEASRHQHNKWPVVIHYKSLACSKILRRDVVRSSRTVVSEIQPRNYHSTAIFACGPNKLNDDARSMACWMIENSDSYVDYFEESFSW